MAGEATRRFAELVARPEEDVPLDEAALLIAAHGEPGLDVGHQLGRLDELAGTCPAPDLDALVRHLFDDHGFRGNTENYADPGNSYLHAVMDRRLGIPITLSVLTIEVARRLDVALVGVGMPGHFLVRHLGDPPVFLDPFSGGRRLDEAGCEAIFRRLGGSGPWQPSYVDSVGPRAILNRMLVNLQGLFLPGRLRPAAWVLELRLAIPGLPRAERRGLARALGSIGRFDAAGAVLEGLAESLPESEGDELRAEALGFRARLN
jgi:regulator of sirC expression with transglutaminase-like and TPR domain